MWPHRRQPTRLRRPWDSPGKNTGVGCHFLLQSMKVKSESEVAQSCPTLRDPLDCSLPGSSVHGIFQARVLEWVAIAFSDNGVYCGVIQISTKLKTTQISTNKLLSISSLFSSSCRFLSCFPQPSQSQSSPWDWPLKPGLKHPAPANRDRRVSQAGDCRTAVLTCAGYSLFCLPQTSCCALLLGSEASALSSLVWSPHTCSAVGTFPPSQLPSLGHRLHPDSFFLFFLLSYLVMWRFSRLFGSLRSSAGIQ